MTDVVRLQGMSFYGYHGVTAAEKETGRLFEIDCEFEVDLAKPGQSDRLADTIDYTAVYDAIKETVEGKAYSLLEGLGTSLASKLLDTFEVFRVTLKVRKISPPVAGQVRYVEVEITRHQSDVSKLVDNEKSK